MWGWLAALSLSLFTGLTGCGGKADDAPDPGLDGTLVLARSDLHAVVGATSTGDIVVVTDDGSVLALDAAASFAPTLIIASLGGRLDYDLRVDVFGGAVLMWRDRGGDTWDLAAWSRATGLVSVATGLGRPASNRVATASLDGRHIAIATGGVFTDGVGSDVLFYGATLSDPVVKPVQLARIPAIWANVELAFGGNRAVLKRYRDAAVAHDLSSHGWPDSQEEFEATWYDEAWQPVSGVDHSESIALGDTALRVATNGADGELAVVALGSGAPVSVDHDCRFAEAFFLPGDEELVYACRGNVYRFTITSGVRTMLAGGSKRAYPLQCGDSRCHDWVGVSGPLIVPAFGDGSAAGRETLGAGTAEGSLVGLSPDGRFARVPVDQGAIGIVEVGHGEHRIVLDPAARGFAWLQGGSFVFVTTTEANKRYEDAASTVTWRDASVKSGGSRVVTRNAFSPYARASENALYAISKAPDRVNGLYRFALP